MYVCTVCMPTRPKCMYVCMTIYGQAPLCSATERVPSTTWTIGRISRGNFSILSGWEYICMYETLVFCFVCDYIYTYIQTYPITNILPCSCFPGTCSRDGARLTRSTTRNSRPLPSTMAGGYGRSPIPPPQVDRYHIIIFLVVTSIWMYVCRGLRSHVGGLHRELSGGQEILALL